jgi:hypothetical protein
MNSTSEPPNVYDVERVHVWGLRVYTETIQHELMFYFFTSFQLKLIPLSQRKLKLSKYSPRLKR